MTFKAIVDAVLAGRFKESQRADAKNWVNFRLAWIYDLEQWTFTQGAADVAVTAGSKTVSGLPADFASAIGLFRADGAELAPLDWHDYEQRYRSADAGAPEAFTVFGAGATTPTVLVGPPSNETSSVYRLLYEKRATLLVADGDVPGIPEEHHFGLVHGGRSEGMKLQNDPTWQSVEQDFLATIDTMRRKWLNPMRGMHRQTPAYRPR